jgi:hypothetical protein
MSRPDSAKKKFGGLTLIPASVLKAVTKESANEVMGGIEADQQYSPASHPTTTTLELYDLRIVQNRGPDLYMSQPTILSHNYPFTNRSTLHTVHSCRSFLAKQSTRESGTRLCEHHSIYKQDWASILSSE